MSPIVADKIFNFINNKKIEYFYSLSITIRAKWTHQLSARRRRIRPRRSSKGMGASVKSM